MSMGKTLLITIVRHGETNFNVQRLIQGHTDSILSDIGIKQAELLGKKVATNEEKFTKVYSSDLIRAYHTAQLVLKNSGNDHITIEKDTRLRERCYGEAEGKPARDLFDEAKKLKLHVHDYTPNGAEPSISVMERAESFFRNLCDMSSEEGSEESILIFTHGGWIQYFMKNIHKMEHKYMLENFDPSKAITIHKNTAMSKFTVNSVNGEPKLKISFHTVNDADHLEDL